MQNHKHLGVLAHSAEGAALCFLTFCREGFEKIGPHLHPDVTVDCMALGRSMAAWENGNYAEIREILATSIERLAAAGAEFFVCPDNTAHIVLEMTGPELPLPGLNIADVVAAEAVRRGMRRVGVLGTKFTMNGPVYPRALGARGVDCAAPAPEDRAVIDWIIFDELVEGRFTDRSRATFAEIIARLASDGCDGAALVCTEIPLLVTPETSPLPTLDSTRLLAKAAFDVAVGNAPAPQWRGGPVADPPAV
ncbi:MAG: aspartate/glutamate racemase family protein [Parvularculaceae bacterium]